MTDKPRMNEIDINKLMLITNYCIAGGLNFYRNRNLAPLERAIRFTAGMGFTAVIFIFCDWLVPSE